MPFLMTSKIYLSNAHLPGKSQRATSLGKPDSLPNLSFLSQTQLFPECILDQQAANLHCCYMSMWLFYQHIQNSSWFGKHEGTHSSILQTSKCNGQDWNDSGQIWRPACWWWPVCISTEVCKQKEELLFWFWVSWAVGCFSWAILGAHRSSP